MRELIRKMDTYKPVPNQVDHACFGCGPMNPMGLKLKFYTDEERVFTSLELAGHLSGWGKIAHGGILSTVIDETMAWTAMYLTQKYMLTKSFTVKFLKPVFVDTEIQAVGRIREVQENKFGMMEAYILDESGEVAVEAEGNLRLFSPQEIRERSVLDEAYLKDFEAQVFQKNNDPAK